MTTTGATGKAVTTKKLFSRETAVSIDVQADKSILWALLTNAHDFHRWNSTVLSLEGTIAPGEKIKLIAQLDPKRVFNLKIKNFDTDHCLVWGDAMGSRMFTLKPIGTHLTNFTMHEKIGGPLFPLFAHLIPSLDEAFEQFAKDLKNEAETISKTK